MQDNKLIVTHPDGSQTIVKNPFAPIKAVYAALAENPEAIPELSDESRAEILGFIELEKRKTLKEQEEKEKETREYGMVMNRHERRKQAAIARRK